MEKLQPKNNLEGTAMARLAEMFPENAVKFEKDDRKVKLTLPEGQIYYGETAQEAALYAVTALAGAE